MFLLGRLMGHETKEKLASVQAFFYSHYSGYITERVKETNDCKVCQRCNPHYGSRYIAGKDFKVHTKKERPIVVEEFKEINGTVAFKVWFVVCEDCKHVQWDAHFKQPKDHYHDYY